MAVTILGIYRKLADELFPTLLPNHYMFILNPCVHLCLVYNGALIGRGFLLRNLVSILIKWYFHTQHPRYGSHTVVNGPVAFISVSTLTVSLDLSHVLTLNLRDFEAAFPRK